MTSAIGCCYADEVLVVLRRAVSARNRSVQRGGVRNKRAGAGPHTEDTISPGVSGYCFARYWLGDAIYGPRS
jgi:hypothetical protein